MNKSKLYAVVVFLLSFGVVIGGWFLTEELRMCKDDEEITAMRKVAAFTDYCMGEIIKILDAVFISA